MTLFLLFFLQVKTPYYDEGRLEFSYFSEEQVLPFKDAEPVDFLWVKEGFRFEGQSFQFEEIEVCDPFIGEDGDGRDEADRNMANEIAKRFPRDLELAFNLHGDNIKVKKEGASYIISGRVVDASTGNSAVKHFVGFGAGAGNVAFDLKIHDAKSGELVFAAHHRAVSGTNFSNSKSKFHKYVKKMVKKCVKAGPHKLYLSGKTPKEDVPERD